MVAFTYLPPVRITSPVASTASRPSTWCRVTPYFTARIPPALVATLPPRLALVLAGIDRIHEAVGRGRLFELVERDTRLDHRAVVVEVDLDDALHAVERTDDAVGARDRRARQPGARTTRGHRHAAAARRRGRRPRPRPCPRAGRPRAAAPATPVSASSWVYSSGIASPVSTWAGPTTSRRRSRSRSPVRAMGQAAGRQHDRCVRGAAAAVKPYRERPDRDSSGWLCDRPSGVTPDHDEGVP